MNKNTRKCKRLIRRNTGDEHDMAFLEHIRECDHCRSMDTMLRLASEDEYLEGLVPPLNDLSRRKMADSIIKSLNEEELIDSSIPKTNYWGKILIGAAAVLLLGLIPWVWTTDYPQVDEPDQLPLSSVAHTVAPVQVSMSSTKPDTSSEPQPAVFPIVGTRFAILTGEVFMGEQAAKAAGPVLSGASVHTGNGSAIVTLPQETEICISKHTSLMINKDKNGKVTVDLSHGNALFSLNPEIERNGFRVKTTAGEIVAMGTVFSIESKKQQVTVNLHQGKLILMDLNGGSKRIGAGQSVTMGTDDIKTVPTETTAKMKEWVGKLKGIGLAEHTWFMGEENDETKKVSTSAALPKKILNNTPPTLKELMAQARTYKRNKDWGATSKTYKEIIRTFPDSDDAKTSLVFLGQLNLNRLGRPDKALRYFDKYIALDGHGPLLEEAFWGKGKALRKIGNLKAEKQVLSELVSRYPNGIHTTLAKKRLDELP